MKKNAKSLRPNELRALIKRSQMILDSRKVQPS